MSLPKKFRASERELYKYLCQPDASHTRSDMAKAIGVHPGYVSLLLRHLEQRSLIRRRYDWRKKLEIDVLVRLEP